ncbi:MAG: hypothetical protein GX777_01465, partial [Fastidiosipila sp.]|nr:hypothetical protein [Fastidiosipila sp.]
MSKNAFNNNDEKKLIGNDTCSTARGPQQEGIIGSACDVNSSCACSDEPEEMSRSEEKFKTVLLFVSIAIFIGGLVTKFALDASTVSIVFMIIAWLLAGYKVMISAMKKLFSGFIMEEQFLMTVATVGAVILGEYPEAAPVMILYQIGAHLEHFAVGKSRQS